MNIPWLQKKVEFRWMLIGFKDKLSAEQQHALERVKLKLADACVIWNKYYEGKFSISLITLPSNQAGLQIAYEIISSDQRLINRENLLQSALTKTHQSINSCQEEIGILSLSSIRVQSQTDYPVLTMSTSDRDDFEYLPIEPIWKFEDIDLSNKTQAELDRVMALINNQSLIFNQWGLKKLQPKPKVLVNLYGPPGTGKTMVVHAIANGLQLKIMEYSYAQVESKYLGQGPKNLHSIFELAHRNRDMAILFFDEADALLGKRLVNIEQGSDQAVNAMRSQMLFELDHFDGIVVFATNFHEVYDHGFLSRLISIRFELPDEDIRRSLLRRFLVDDLPGSKEVDLKGLINMSQGLSGRDIRDVVITAATDMSRDPQNISLDFCLKEAIKNLVEVRQKSDNKNSHIFQGG